MGCIGAAPTFRFPQVQVHFLCILPPGGRLPLLSARPAVTFPAAEHHRPLAGTKLYCLVKEAHSCGQLAEGCYAALSRVGFEPATYWLQVQRSTRCVTAPPWYETTRPQNDSVACTCTDELLRSQPLSVFVQQAAAARCIGYRLLMSICNIHMRQLRNFFISYLCQLFSRHFVGQARRNVCYSDNTFLVT